MDFWTGITELTGHCDWTLGAPKALEDWILEIRRAEAKKLSDWPALFWVSIPERFNWQKAMEVKEAPRRGCPQVEAVLAAIPSPICWAPSKMLSCKRRWKLRIISVWPQPQNHPGLHPTQWAGSRRWIPQGAAKANKICEMTRIEIWAIGAKDHPSSVQMRTPTQQRSPKCLPRCSWSLPPRKVQVSPTKALSIAKHPDWSGFALTSSANL